jgi:hypothetical protein
MAAGTGLNADYFSHARESLTLARVAETTAPPTVIVPMRPRARASTLVA